MVIFLGAHQGGEAFSIPWLRTSGGPSEIRQGSLEEANVDVVTAMVDMITVMRTYEANQKVLQVQDQTLEKVVNEVGRVG